MQLNSTSISELEDVITRLSDELKALEDKRGLIHGSEKMYNHYLEKMEKKGRHADCPLCSREFDEPSEVEELVKELKNRIEGYPTTKEDLDRKILEKKEKHGSLIQLRPQVESAERLSHREIPEMQTELNRLENHLKAMQAEQETEKEEIERLKSNDEIGKKAYSDVMQLDALQVTRIH